MGKKNFIILFFIFIFYTYTFAGQIELPKTGQTKCYNSSGNEISCTDSGQDGDIRSGLAWPNPRFTVNGDCVADNLTGLIWAKNANLPNGQLTWEGALNYIDSLNNGEGLCGFKDWRLPNIRELLSLINYDKTGSLPLGWLNSEGFENLNGFLYWSSTTAEPSSSNAWDIFDWGVINHNPKTTSLYVWPVRSNSSGRCQIPKTGQTKCYNTGGNEIPCAGTRQDGDLKAGVTWPDPRFTIDGNETVTDTLTGLIWAKNIETFGPSECGNATNLTWEESLDYIKCLNDCNYLNYNKWRAPNINELLSLIDFSKNNPALPTGNPFGDINCQLRIWTSTTSVANPTSAWTVEIPHGWTFFRVDKQVELAVWPVTNSNNGGFKALPFIPLLLIGN